MRWFQNFFKKYVLCLSPLSFILNVITSDFCLFPPVARSKLPPFCAAKLFLEHFSGYRCRLHFFPCWTDHVGVCFPGEEPRKWKWFWNKHHSPLSSILVSKQMHFVVLSFRPCADLCIRPLFWKGETLHNQVHHCCNFCNP